MSFIKSITDFKFYKSIYNQSLKKSLLYFLILSVVVYVLGALVMVTQVELFMKSQAAIGISLLPDFSVKNGELSVNAKQPIKFVYDNTAFIFDTKTTSDSIVNSENYPQAIIFAKDDIKVVSEANTKSFKYQAVLDKLNVQTLDKEKLKSFLPNVKRVIQKWIVIVHAIMFIFWLVFYKLLTVLVVSVIALIVSYVKKANLNYKNLINITIYALTLPWLLNVLYKVFLFDFPLTLTWFIFALLNLIIATVYINFAVKAVQKDNNNDMSGYRDEDNDVVRGNEPLDAEDEIEL